MTARQSLRRNLTRWLPASIATWLRRWVLRRDLKRFPRRVAEHVYWGHRLNVWIVDALSAGWYDQPWGLLPEIPALRRSGLKPGATVFDLGAHQGVVALLLAREVGPTGTVVAVEPVGHNVEVARLNLDLNRPARIEIVHAAISNRAGTVAISDGLQARLDLGDTSASRQDVMATTIDALAETYGQPDVVVIDVEGAEHLALRGAARTIAAGADFLVEVHAGGDLEALGGTPLDIIAAFPEARYTLQLRAGNDERPDAFQPCSVDSPILRSRCFLLAMRSAPSDVSRSASG